MKKLIFLFLFFISTLVFPATTLGQGTYICQPLVSNPTGCQPGNGPAYDKCQNGYQPGTECDKFSYTNCKGTFTCIKDTGMSTTELSEDQDPRFGCSNGGINTAIGCIPINDTNAFVSFLLKWGVGVGAGVAFLLIIYAGFQITTASGDPERLKGGQELMTSAIAGLILIIFSAFILQVIGVDILKIPGFSK